ncbi:MAG: AMP-binding protein [Verrucomicrobiota bacterium]
MFLKLARAFARLFYRVTVHGSDKLPTGGFLLLPNHVTWVDAIVLQIAFPRPIRFLIWEPIYRQPLLNPLFRLLGGIPITNRRAKEAVRHASELIRNGEVVCIFPEGELTRTGILLRLKRGYELIAHEANAPVVPVWLDQLWGSIFSFQGNKYFNKIPRHFPYPVTVAFGAPIAPEKADIATVRQTLLELGEFCYQQRPILRGHLGEASLRGLKHKQFDVAITDGIDGSQITHGMLLAVSIALSRHIRKNCPSKRIGSVLPTSIGAVAANLAVMLAGKVPVNLNFTAGRAALEAAIRIADIDTAITAKAFMKRAGDFPFPKNLLLVDELIPHLKPWIIFWRVLVVLMPWWVLTRILGIPSVGDREEAVVLFTSGSSGEPKGVVLSHRNLLGNVTQFSSMLNLDRHDSVLASLPYFHSFGCTVTLWYPLIEGVQLVTNPNPIDVPKNAELIARHKITMLLATPTFLRGYIKRADPKQLETLKLIVTGAEKLPNEVVAAFGEKFGKEVEQGYGLTETSPVVSVNLPDPPKFKPDDNVQSSSRLGSAGKLAPGIAAQIRDPETGAPLTLHDTGMLWLRGPNIFEGYLNDPKRTAEVLVDGWFKTGDLGRFDEDGFLYIEGRLSRFSKIGGEMVPHETLESNIYTALQIPSEGERSIAVVGVPDEAKGEALVLLSVPELSAQELRSKLLESGVPALWIPKSIRRVEKIPVLGSGKLDIKQCKELATGTPSSS